MPVFGKGRQNRVRHKLLRKGVYRVSVDPNKQPPRQYHTEERWSVRKTPLDKIETNLAFPITRFISNRLRSRKKPVEVLDWGCGTGIAAETLGKKMKDKAIVFGCSADSYTEWADATHVHLLHTTGPDLFRYLKSHSFDLIYSHWGLRNTRYMETNLGQEIGNRAEYIAQLVGKLKKNGKLVFDIAKGDEDLSTMIRKLLGPHARVEYHEKKHPQANLTLRIIEITRLK